MKRKFFILWVAGVFSAVLSLPYIFALQQDVVSKTGLPLWQVALMATVQTGVLLAVTTFLGLRLAQSIGLGSSVLVGSGLLSAEKIKSIIKLSVPVGVVVGLVIKLGDLFFTRSIPDLVAAVDKIAVWKIILVAPYGGVVEELLLRLFMVSLLVWLMGKIFRVTELVSNNTIMWVAIVLAAVIFGLGHLPVTATITEITTLVVVRAIVLNGVGGLAFGWLYWKRGLEYAVLAHFTTDIVLLVILPQLFKMF